MDEKLYQRNLLVMRYKTVLSIHVVVRISWLMLVVYRSHC